MKKSDRISAYVEALGDGAEPGLAPEYLGYFTCFNAAQYYEAHDVLEHLWLKTPGGDHLFFKGLIQVAGAFVHLQKQRQFPEHPKHAPRLRPAVRLFELGAKNLGAFEPAHLRLDVAGVVQMCRRFAAAIVASEYSRNPWNPAQAPHLSLEGTTLV